MCLSAIVTDSVFNQDKHYFQLALLEECEYKTKEKKKIKLLNVDNIESSSHEDSSSDENNDSSDEDDINNYLEKYDNNESHYPPYDLGDNYYPLFCDDSHNPLADQ